MCTQDFITKDVFTFEVVIIDWNDENMIRIGVNA